MSYCEGFQPIIPTHPKIMILGTMPSVKSLEDAFYYAHPQNAFWGILSCVFSTHVSSITDKKKLLFEQQILLWDVLQSCQRQGSLDSAIEIPVANDFEKIFQQYPELKSVLFNGQAAYKLFKKQVVPLQNLPENLEFHVLPSTSPANARLTFENKRFLWQETLSKII